MKVTVRGLAGVLTIALCSVCFYTTVFVWPCFLFVLLKYTLGEGAVARLYGDFHKIADAVVRLYLVLIAAAIELIIGTSVAYTLVDAAGQGHLRQHYTTAEGLPALGKLLTAPSAPGKSKLIVMNHHTRVDWLYLFVFLARCPGLAPCLRVVLKEELRRIPYMGWAMEFFRFLFLSRKWEVDEAYLRRMVRYFTHHGEAVAIFIFPEGTDLSPSNIAKSNAFAAQQQLPQFRHVLNPHTTGTVALKSLLGAAQVEEVIDLTVGYTYAGPGERPDEPSLLSGRHARKAHLLAQVFRFDTAPAGCSTSVSVVPYEDGAFATWLHGRFAAKELLLSRFTQRSPVGFDDADVRAVFGEAVGVATFDDDVEDRRRPQQSRCQRFAEQVGGLHVFAVACVTWLGPLVYLTWYFTWLKLVLFVAWTLVHLPLTRRRGSLQNFLLHEVQDDETLVARAQRLMAGEPQPAGKQA
ncbi:acetyltransferase [Strigomonas culicis]|uniref:Acetyltransferase n=1 Tax=Strigomonas culicis TaxID=28005 RepID=S9UMY9_9TRYP|nr:acetyltransferase [Strigomonas culicis]|eukprot:EPY32212.1 acetyltransferase [Strigomonas culicis]